MGWSEEAYEGAEGCDYGSCFERHFELFVMLGVVCWYTAGRWRM